MCPPNDIRASSCRRNVADDDPVRTDANALRDYLRDGGRHTGGGCSLLLPTTAWAVVPARSVIILSPGTGNASGSVDILYAQLQLLEVSCLRVIWGHDPSL